MLPPPTSSPLFPYTTLFRSLEARDLGKLNVHQDEVRAMRACERYRVEPVARLDGAVAVCVQEVVKELHVELVVLHDQHGLRRTLGGVCGALDGRPRLLVGHDWRFARCSANTCTDSAAASSAV